MTNRPRYNTSRDENQSPIVEELRQLGFYVRDVSAHIAEWDIEVWGWHSAMGCYAWGHFEIKTETGKMQSSQTAFQMRWGYEAVPVVTRTDDVIDWYKRR